MGRWLNRDPMGEFVQDEESGETNHNLLYGFVANDGINKWDRLGLWTGPDRQGERWASTCAEKGDTFKKLADLLLLEELQAFGSNGWLKNKDGSDTKKGEKIKVGKTFKVPNVIIYFRGPRDSFWDPSYDIMTRLASYPIERMKNSGYQVLEFKNSTKNSFIASWKTKGIYGVVFFGHGKYATLGTGVQM